jgi:hypothetical protein
MKSNVGGTDRTVRVVVGPVLAVLGSLVLAGVIAINPIVGGSLLLIGVVLLVTGLTRRCFINRVLGVDTASNR